MICPRTTPNSLASSSPLAEAPLSCACADCSCCESSRTLSSRALARASSSLCSFWSVVADVSACEAIASAAALDASAAARSPRACACSARACSRSPCQAAFCLWNSAASVVRRSVLSRRRFSSSARKTCSRSSMAAPPSWACDAALTASSSCDWTTDCCAQAFAAACKARSRSACRVAQPSRRPLSSSRSWHFSGSSRRSASASAAARLSSRTLASSSSVRALRAPAAPASACASASLALSSSRSATSASTLSVRPRSFTAGEEGGDRAEAVSSASASTSLGGVAGHGDVATATPAPPA
mmetsp:Transcript_85197/g.275866  ORF Transcript_85197/g.275866 Transcript_85197/m.275866 type:complete len:299 (+) Transcript_85197:784-1680(+)